MTPDHPTPDALDAAFADYFQRQMPRPWPPAPAVAATPTPARVADPSRRARWTLAASVAVLAGCCWLLSSDGRPGRRPGPQAPSPVIADPFGGSTATMPDALKTPPRPAGSNRTPAGPIELP